MSIILDEQDNEWVRVMPHLRTDCVEEEKVCSGLQFSSCQFHKVQASKFPLKDSIPTPFNRWEGEKLIMMFRHVAELGTQISDGSVYVTNGFIYLYSVNRHFLSPQFNYAIYLHLKLRT
jgi:hypothetical protein